MKKAMSVKRELITEMDRSYGIAYRSRSPCLGLAEDDALPQRGRPGQENRGLAQKSCFQKPINSAHDGEDSHVTGGDKVPKAKVPLSESS